MTPLKMAILGVIGALFATQMFLKQTFPHPAGTDGGDEIAGAAIVDPDASFKMTILHTLVYLGVAIVGMLAIMHNGRAFIDDASTLNL